MFVDKIFVFLCVIYAIRCGRVLVVVPTPSISHQVVFRPLTQELARRGHQVVVITTDPAYPKGQAPENLTEIDVHDLSYEMKGKAFFAATQGNNNDLLIQMKCLTQIYTVVFEKQMTTAEVQSVIGNKTNHFDLIMTEAHVRPAIALVHVFKAPLILISSLGSLYTDMYDIVGAPSRPILQYPTLYRQRLVNLSLWERLSELYNHYLIENIFDSQKTIDDIVVKRLFGQDTPSIKELKKKVDMIFLNVNPIWEFNRPVSPAVIYMGGLHQKPTKELPTDLKSYLDSSKHGVIYVSYGTNVDPTQLPSEKIQILVKTFSQLPYDVLWKWNNDELPGRSNNIKISKWLPQSDLLKHPKVKLFITQGGLQSTDEAITAGVPLIGMPLYADQWYNVEHYVYHGLGLRVDMETLSEDKLRTAIDTILKEDSYRANIVKLRAIMRDQPQPPLDRAVWWAEHVMRHGGASHLRARVGNMTWSEYLDLDLIAIVCVGAIFVLIIVGYAVSLLSSFAKGFRKIKSD